MDFFEAVRKRRSVRKFKPEPFPDEYVRRALEAAVLAPNSSNAQTWDFHWIKLSSSVRPKVVKACLSQSAARTAQHIVVVTVNRKNWKRSRPRLLEWIAPLSVHKTVTLYYQKVFPLMYTAGPFNILSPIKWIVAFAIGLFRPITRGPFTQGAINNVAVKSGALASENFVLAITAQGGATCMMEGFDEWRMKLALRLPWSARVVMAIGVGYEGERGIWGPQYRLPFDDVVHIHE